MGFFDSSSSNTTKNYIEKTNTTTSTKIGDVGLTGQNIVDFFNINARANSDIAKTLSSVTKESANAFKLYAGGTNEVARNAINAKSDVLINDNVKRAGLFIAGGLLLLVIYKKVA